MNSTTETVTSHSPASAQASHKGRLWAGWILSGITVAFLWTDALLHLLKPAPVIEAGQRLGMPLHMSTVIGEIMIVALVVYAYPRTLFLGVILITGYLGGAVSIHLRAGSSLFETIFPVLIGLIAWGGVYLREPRLRALIPFRS